MSQDITTASTTAILSAEEKKQQRLAAWRQKQQQLVVQAPPPPPQVHIPSLPIPPPPPPSVPVVPKLSWTSLAVAASKDRRNHKKRKKAITEHDNISRSITTTKKNPFDDDDDEDEDINQLNNSNTKDINDSNDTFSIQPIPYTNIEVVSIKDSNNSKQNRIEDDDEEIKRPRKKNRWGASITTTTMNDVIQTTSNTVVVHNDNNTTTDKDGDNNNNNNDDTLDQFMAQLHSVAVDEAVPKIGNAIIHVSGSVQVPIQQQQKQQQQSILLPKQNHIQELNTNKDVIPNTIVQQQQQHQPKNVYNPSDWLSDVNPNTDNEADDTDNEDEQRWALINALKQQDIQETTSEKDVEHQQQQEQLLMDDKLSFKQQHEKMVKVLADAARQVREAQKSNVQDIGREFFVTDEDDGVVEEAIREYDVATQQQNDRTFILLNNVEQTMNKKKELSSTSSTNQGLVQYEPFQKNIYRVPKAVAALTTTEITNRRAKLRIRVRGVQIPAPVLQFHEMGFPNSILQYMIQQQHITTPYPIQAQCIPCILAGRDVIGIAKTGSGKTLAYVLPMLRHIIIQPPLSDMKSTSSSSSNKGKSDHNNTGGGGGGTGPIALILVPARELAFQIHSVCKPYAKILGLKSTAIYGGAGVAEQIADLKRGTHIVTATPGRLIDILTMQSGRLFSLHRVTYVVMDEADRMYDMGFAPQITAILAGIRPDRQIVLFSATFPKAIEALARQSLKYPVEVMVGGRSVASDSVTQYAELVEESDKFFRLLQILGEQVEGTKKVIVFVDTQVRADNLFEKLLRNGYSTLSLHGGKEQEDRDSTISDFKRKDGPNVLVATGVAGRGLDVPSCSCVVNYAAPNHLEAYVHQTGRTGRAGNRGVAYTLVNPADEAKYAPVITRALAEAGQAEHIDPALLQLSEDFKTRVEKGEAKYAGNGFKGKGYSYDSTEMNESQRAVKLEKRQALIEAGMLDPDDEDTSLMTDLTGINAKSGDDNDTEKTKTSTTTVSGGNASTFQIPENLTPEVLALPGMKEALMRRAGIVPTAAQEAKAQEENDLSLGRPVKTGDNHWVQEFEINDYPREARWKVTQKETTSRLQDEFRTAVTMKGSYVPPGRTPGPNERKIYLHLEATSSTILRNAVLEIQRMLNEETLRVSMKTGTTGSHKYNVLS